MQDIKPGDIFISKLDEISSVTYLLCVREVIKETSSRVDMYSCYTYSSWSRDWYIALFAKDEINDDGVMDFEERREAIRRLLPKGIKEYG